MSRAPARVCVRYLAAALLLVGCGTGDRPAPAGGVSDNGAVQPAPAPARPGSPDPGAPASTEPPCLAGDHSFVAAGAMDVAGAASGAGDATQLRELRWQAHDGCERVVFDLADAGSVPAGSARTVRAELLRELGIVRVHLPGVALAEPGATDAVFGGSLARAAYAVRSPDGPYLFVDVHLAGPAQARVSALADPARVVVDLRPGGGPIPAPAVAGQRVVVLQPRPGPASYPLQVVGYARTFEANVVARLERAGQQVFEGFTTSSGWLEGWGYYTITIPEGPAGSAVLHVGEYSARDGAWEGVPVELEMR